MAINNSEFATKFTGELDKQLRHKSVTSFMEDSSFKVNFVGAKTIKIPEIDMLALGDYDRDTGFAKGSVSVGYAAYTLSEDRGREFNIDRENMDETGIAELAGAVVSEFNEMKVVPEIDEHSISKVAGVAIEKKNFITTNEYPVATKAYDAFDKLYVDTKEIVGDMELVCLVSYDYWGALRRTSEISQNIINSDFKSGEVSRVVKKIDDCYIIPVPSERMFSIYESLDGQTGTGYNGGLTPAKGAHKIKMLMMTKDTARRVRKLEKIKIFSADENQQMDAWKFQYRLYYDVFVKNSRLDVPHILYEPAAAVTESTQENEN